MRAVGVMVGVVVGAWLLRSPAAAQEPVDEGPSALSADALFAGAELHDIWIHIHPRDWEQLISGFRTNTYYPADVEWRGLRVRNVGIRVRGRNSRSDRKPGLLLNFNYYVTDQEFLGLKSLVLDNLVQDPSMIRERLAMRVFQRMGLPAPREAHARLFIGADHEFAGVYGVVEPIDKRFLERTFGEDDGYLYEYHWLNPFSFEDPEADLEWYAARFEPRTHENESMADLFSPIRNLVRTVSEAPRSRLEETLEPYLDLRTFITHIAIDNFLSEPDGVIGGLGMNNFYLYRFEDQTRSQLLVWDQDLAFESLATRPEQNLESNILSRKIWASPGLRAIYLATLLRIARSVGPPEGTPAVADPAARQCPAPDGEPPCGWLEEQVFHDSEQVRAAALADPRKPHSNETFEQQIEFLKEFARTRSEIVRRYVADFETTGAQRVR